MLLVGGSTRLLFVREYVQQKFGKQPNTSLPPEEVVALGATLFAGNLAFQEPGFDLPANTLRKVSSIREMKQDVQVERTP